MIVTGVTVMVEGDGWIGVFAGLTFFAVRSRTWLGCCFAC